MKELVIYFSAQGTTKKVAEDFALAKNIPTYEIIPEKPYTKADITWTNPLARCNKEKFGRKEVPVVGKVEDFSEYDIIYLGFPIWYYGAPNIINTFCKGYDFTGKKLVLFATSGGSPIGKTVEKLSPYIKGAKDVIAVLVKSGKELAELLK